MEGRRYHGDFQLLFSLALQGARSSLHASSIPKIFDLMRYMLYSQCPVTGRLTEDAPYLKMILGYAAHNAISRSVWTNNSDTKDQVKPGLSRDFRLRHSRKREISPPQQIIRGYILLFGFRRRKHDREEAILQGTWFENNSWQLLVIYGMGRGKDHFISCTWKLSNIETDIVSILQIRKLVLRD